MSTRRRPVLIALLVLWTVAVVALTSWPTGYMISFTWKTFLHIGRIGSLSDMLLNWAMFVPAGVLAAGLLDVRRVVVLAFCFTVGIETVQVAMPGRSPGIQDLVFNTLGAYHGVLLARRGLGRRLQRALVAVAAMAWLAPLALSTRIAPAEELHGMWTPVRDSRRYEGRVLGATVGRVDLPSAAIGDRDALAEAVSGRHPVAVTLEVGPAPPEFVSIVQVVAAPDTPVMTVGAIDDDLVLKMDDVSRLTGARSLEARWHGGLAGLAAGDTVELLIEPGRASTCMSVDGRTACGLAPGLEDGWGHLFNPARGWPRLRATMAILWPLGLGLLLGAASSSLRASLPTAVGVAAVGHLAAGFSSGIRPGLSHAVLFVAGSIGGSLLREPVGRSWTVFFAGAMEPGTGSPTPGDASLAPADVEAAVDPGSTGPR